MGSWNTVLRICLAINLACREAGGTLAEAIDHLMTTKILRKLQNRHDIRPEYLQELLTSLQEEAIESKVVEGKLVRSEELVRKELKRLGFDDD
jgi:glucose-6-phosphate-specific signal transduction histidine kinase